MHINDFDICKHATLEVLSVDFIALFRFSTFHLIYTSFYSIFFSVDLDAEFSKTSARLFVWS